MQPKALKKPQYTPNPYSYLLYVSMINSFLCCFCTGLVAVYYSTKVTIDLAGSVNNCPLIGGLGQVNSSWVYGEFQNAGKYAQRAKIWNVLTAAVGFLLVVTMVVLVTLSNTGFLLSSSTTRQTSSTRYNFHVN